MRNIIKWDIRFFITLHSAAKLQSKKCSHSSKIGDYISRGR
jgi:hypothetical protein